MRKSSLIAALAYVALGGCASAPSGSSTNIDYGRQSYEGTRFEKPGVDVATQQTSFKTDVDDCEAVAQQNYQESLARRAQLSQFYGQSVTPKVLATMKLLQVHVCMAGDRASSDKGKGWKVVSPS